MFGWPALTQRASLGKWGIMDNRSTSRDEVAALSQALDASVKAREAIMRRIQQDEAFDILEAWEQVQAYDDEVQRLLGPFIPDL